MPFTFCLLNPHFFNFAAFILLTILGFIFPLHDNLNLENTEFAAATLIY